MNSKESPLKTMFQRNVLLVDLDGTLTDPAEGIVGCFRFALTAVGCAAPTGIDLSWIIGPPLRQSFAKMLADTGDVEAALAIYRTRYGAEGLFEAVVYDGVTEALSRLKQSGARLFTLYQQAVRLCGPHPRPLRPRALFRGRIRLRTRWPPRGQGGSHRPYSCRAGAGPGRLRHIGRPQARRRWRESARDSDHRRAVGLRRRAGTARCGRRGAMRRAGKRSGRLRALHASRSPRQKAVT